MPDNIIKIAVDAKGFLREYIRAMTDEELDAFLANMAEQSYVRETEAYMKGFMDGSLSALFGNEEEE